MRDSETKDDEVIIITDPLIGPIHGDYEKFGFAAPPEYSKEWECYLYGSRPGDASTFIYVPIEGRVPNRFVRWVMKIIGCTWIKK